LYFLVAEGEAPSPLGSLVGQAAQAGYLRGGGVYQAYSFKLLTAQRPGAIGGESDYLVNGKLLGGF